MRDLQIGAVLFDLDGTLADTVPDLAHSVDQALSALGLTPPGEAAVRDWVGNGVEALVSRALTHATGASPPATLQAAAMAQFLPIYARLNGCHSTLYPGVREALAYLSDEGIAMGCVTNKPGAFTRPLLGQLEIAHYFWVVISGDEAPARKPDPAPLLMALAALGCTPHEALFVGDSVHDVEAARRAGVRVLGVPYGYNHGQDIADCAPDGIIARLDELAAFVRRRST